MNVILVHKKADPGLNGCIALCWIVLLCSVCNNTTATPPASFAQPTGAPSAASHAPMFRLSRPLPPVMVNAPNETIAQSVLDDLKSGKPQILSISLDDSAIEAEGAAIRKQRNLPFDDEQIIELKRQRYKTLKTEVLGMYESDELKILKEYPNTAQVIASVANIRVLQLLLSDPRVAHINSPIPVYPQ